VEAAESPERAFALCQEVIDLNGDFVSDAYNLRGMLRARMGSMDQALKDFSDAIGRQPNNFMGWYNRGNLHLGRKEYQEAIVDLSQALRLNGALVKARANLAWAYAMAGGYRDAVREADMAIELSPGMAQAYDTRGYSYCMLGDYPRAIENLTKAISMKEDPAFFNNRARAYLRSGQIDKARSDAEACVNLGGKLDADLAKALDR
jgi:Flp pilus assembly protein TadD